MMKFLQHRRLASVILVVLLALFTVGADNINQRFEKTGHELMCTCGCNQILLECNHVGCPSSDGMRNELMAGVKANVNDDTVLQTFVAKYGPTVLAAPTLVGFDRVAWITPYAVFLFGIGLTILIVRNWKHMPKPTHAAGTPEMTDTLKSFRDRAREETEL
ncbi:MAG: hypothetical protein JWO13_2939 [Acidobacteriales bacterium]|nr:hypothetical protein [Terriglobales bacterium]